MKTSLSLFFAIELFLLIPVLFSSPLDWYQPEAAEQIVKKRNILDSFYREDFLTAKENTKRGAAAQLRDLINTFVKNGNEVENEIFSAEEQRNEFEYKFEPENEDKQFDIVETVANFPIRSTTTFNEIPTQNNYQDSPSEARHEASYTNDKVTILSTHFTNPTFFLHQDTTTQQTIIPQVPLGAYMAQSTKLDLTTSPPNHFVTQQTAKQVNKPVFSVFTNPVQYSRPVQLSKPVQFSNPYELLNPTKFSNQVPSPIQPVLAPHQQAQQTKNDQNMAGNFAMTPFTFFRSPVQEPALFGPVHFEQQTSSFNNFIDDGLGVVNIGEPPENEELKNSLIFQKNKFPATNLYEDEELPVPTIHQVTPINANARTYSQPISSIMPSTQSIPLNSQGPSSKSLFETINQPTPDRPARGKLSDMSSRPALRKTDALTNLMKIAGDNWEHKLLTGEDNLHAESEKSFICPGPEGHFPSPDSCDVYYQCAQGTPHKHSCQPGLHWNIVTNQCDWKERVDCGLNTGHSTP